MLASRQIGSTSYPVFSKNFRRLEGKDAWSNNLEIAADFAGDFRDSLLQVVDCGRGLLNNALRKELSQALNLVNGRDGLDLARIKIERKLGGAIEDSRLVRGIFIKKEKRHRSMPD